MGYFKGIAETLGVAGKRQGRFSYSGYQHAGGYLGDRCIPKIMMWCRVPGASSAAAAKIGRASTKMMPGTINSFFSFTSPIIAQRAIPAACLARQQLPQYT